MNMLLVTMAPSVNMFKIAEMPYSSQQICDFFCRVTKDFAPTSDLLGTQ